MRRAALLALVAVLAGACGADDDASRSASTTGAAAEAEGGVRRIAGDDRYETAAVVSLDRWQRPSDVFVANGTDPADALAGAYGSGLHSSPVFLTERDSLPPSTRDALRSITPAVVHVLGGTASVSEAVADAIRAEGYRVNRIAGADRYATAVAVAKSESSAIIGSFQSSGRTALLANGHRPFDALAAGPLAAGQLFPVLLTETDALPPVTMHALDELDIHHVIVLGGTGVVSDAVVASIEASGRTVRRVAGSDRISTAIAVAGVLEELGYDLTRAALLSATSPADALAAGPWAAPATPLLLCESASACGTTTGAWARAHPLDEVVVMGGTASVSDAAASEVASAGR